MKFNKLKETSGIGALNFSTAKLLSLTLLASATVKVAALPASTTELPSVTALPITNPKMAALDNCTAGVVYSWTNNHAPPSNLTACGDANQCVKLGPQFKNYDYASWKSVGGIAGCVIYSGDKCDGEGNLLSTNASISVDGTVGSFRCSTDPTSPEVVAGQTSILTNIKEYGPASIWYAWIDITGYINHESFTLTWQDGHGCRPVVPGHTFYGGAWKNELGWKCTIWSDFDCHGRARVLTNNWLDLEQIDDVKTTAVSSFECHQGKKTKRDVADTTDIAEATGIPFTGAACDAPVVPGVLTPSGAWYSWVDSNGRQNIEGFCAQVGVCRDVVPGQSFWQGTWRASPGWRCNVYSDGHCLGIGHVADGIYRVMADGVMSFVCWPLGKTAARTELVAAAEDSQKEDAITADTIPSPPTLAARRSTSHDTTAGVSARADPDFKSITDWSFADNFPYPYPLTLCKNTGQTPETLNGARAYWSICAIYLASNDHECYNVLQGVAGEVSGARVSAGFTCYVWLKEGCQGTYFIVTPGGGMDFAGTAWDKKLASYQCYRNGLKREEAANAGAEATATSAA